MGGIGSTHWKEFEKFLLAIGCTFVREKGDHRVYAKKGLARPVIIPRDTALPAFIILNNLRTLSVSRKEYLAFLKRGKKK
ncbi:MAG: type II toxin-antitoxin system HicA family toxin [Candidatus Campbellbacteria bacterium]|nr:type II toxin-antitoxin system HicA family toxin [Candidatus Campbellbacteria bacterium]